MVLDISNNVLTIDDSSGQLRPSQISQMHFWGFAKIPGKNTYELPSRKIGDVLPKLRRYLDKEGVSYNLSESSQEYLSALQKTVDSNERIKTSGREFKNGQFDATKFDEFYSFVHRNISRPLKEHQLKAAFHLYLVENGANFSVPGSGKTAVILTVYEKLRLENKVNVLYVVGPPACFGPWKTEFKLTLGRDPDCRVLAGGAQGQRKLEYFSLASQKAELYLTTYQTLLNDQEELIAFLNQRGNKVLLAIDEAHYIKQSGGNWAQAVLRVSEHAEYRCVLTGTPMPRSYTDVFNLFDFLWPHNSPLDSDAKIRIKMQEERNDVSALKDMLKQNIGPLFYRVRKSDLGLVPAHFHPPYVIPMNEYENEIYHAIENRIIDYNREDYLRNIELVKRLRRGRIIRLRQCVSYAKLLLSALEGYDENLIDDRSHLAQLIYKYDSLEIPAKIQHLIKLVDVLQRKKQKVVIWAHFIGTLELIVKNLTESGFACKLIYGATPIERTSIDQEETREIDQEETREQIRNEFIEPSSGLDILVANPAVCGESISLHKTCFHAIYYDLSYNCAQYLQSLDRIHRVGGSEINQANYYFLQYENTIEQDIKQNLENKATKMQEVIDEDYSIYSLDMFEEEEDVRAYERLFGGK